MDTSVNRGLIETKSRILGELLQKTSFKDSLRHFLMNIDPENSPQLVRTMLSTDIEVLLAITGAMPAIANCIIKALAELISQIREKFPPPLLIGLVESLLEEIDKETLAHLINDLKKTAGELRPVYEGVHKAIQDHAEGIKKGD